MRRMLAGPVVAAVTVTALGACSSGGDDSLSGGTSTITPATVTTEPPTTVATPPPTDLATTSTTATTATDPAEPTSPAETSTTAGDTVAPATAQLVDRPCDTAPEYDATCYWLEVPGRRDVDGARTIRLWVAVIEPGTDGPGAGEPPLLTLTGGPGDSASAPWVAGDVDVTIGDGRTLVAIDQRGTGRSEPRLDCPEMGIVAADSGDTVEKRRTARSAAAAACRQRLAESGIDLDGYDTVENAADIAALRTALGIDEWVVRGFSYGSRLARELYRQDPDGVTALVLDSPFPTAPFGPAELIVGGIDAIGRLSRACTEQAPCAALGDPADNLATAAERLERTPVELADPPIAVDAGVLYNGAIQAMYRSDLLPILPSTAAALAAGDDSIIPALGTELSAEPPDPADRPAQGTFEIVSCADDGASLDAADAAAVADPGVWEDLVLTWHYACDVWDVDPVDGGRLADPSGEVPVLVTSGGLDPITPPSNAAEVRRQFPNTTAVLLPGGGHVVAFDTECMTSITLAFIAEPTAPVDSTCLAREPAPYAG